MHLYLTPPFLGGGKGALHTEKRSNEVSSASRLSLPLGENSLKVCCFAMG